MVKSGIYKITNSVNGKFYIGSSINLRQRFNKHRSLLNKNEHVNPILQRAWNRHGASNFSFEVIEECTSDQSTCLAREQYYLDLLKPYLEIGYNIVRKASGGDTFTNHPDKEATREKMRRLNGGEKNGMFGKTHRKSAIKLQRQKAKGRFSLEWFIERNGEVEGTKFYHERRTKLAARKINYSHDNGRKGKTVIVEKTRGASVSKGRNALKGRKSEFLADLSNENLSTRQISDKYGISTSAVKYHRKKKLTNY